MSRVFCKYLNPSSTGSAEKPAARPGLRRGRTQDARAPTTLCKLPSHPLRLPTMKWENSLSSQEGLPALRALAWEAGSSPSIWTNLPGPSCPGTASCLSSGLAPLPSACRRALESSARLPLHLPQKVTRDRVGCELKRSAITCQLADPCPNTSFPIFKMGTRPARPGLG